MKTNELDNRVVVTGIGLVTPVGIGTEETWRNMLNGVSGIDEIRCIDTKAYNVHRGGEVRGFTPSDHVRRLDPATIGRASQLAIAASHMALADAGLAQSGLPDATRAGVALGTTMGEPQVLEKIVQTWIDAGPDAVDERLFPRYPCHNISFNVARELGLSGPVWMIPTACAAGNYAIGHASQIVKSGAADLMLAGGSDCFSQVAYAGFARLGAIAPERCAPFDLNRKGMMVSEGAGVLLLERLDRARARGAFIYGEVLGYGIGCDAFHMTRAHPEGRGMVRAMTKALSSSGVSPGEVDYINAHGTGTAANDELETVAIKNVFGDLAKRIPISTVKSMIGHTMGAASAIEAGVCLLSIRDQKLAPTINLVDPDPKCDLDYVPNTSRSARVRIALNNSLAFGGNNAALLLGRVAE